jgi:hypothetical protein
MTVAEVADELESLRKRLDAVVERSVVLNDELWNWAQYRAKQLGKESVSQCLFDLIREDKKKTK